MNLGVRSIEQLIKRVDLSCEADEIDILPPKTKIQKLVKTLFSNDPETIRKSTKLIRIMLSKEKEPPIQELIDSGAVPKIVSFLTGSSGDTLLESIWILTNVCSGNTSQCRYVVNLGVVPILVQLLQSNDHEIFKQSCWVLGNIAGDNVEFRDLLLEQPVIDSVINHFKNTQSSEHQKCIEIAAWLFSNLCRGKPSPEFDRVKKIINFLAPYITAEVTNTTIDATWCFCHLSNDSEEQINAILDVGILPTFVEMLSFDNPQIQTPALKVLGNIATGNEQQTQKLLETKLLEKMGGMLENKKISLLKESVWLISNITAGTGNQIQQVIDSGIIPKIIELMESQNNSIKNEACWVISNGIYGGSKIQLKYFIDQGCLKKFCHILLSNQSQILEISLDSIERILRYGNDVFQDENPYLEELETYKVVDSLERLLNHENTKIYQLARNILENYSIDDEDLSDEVGEDQL
ncbi:importin alpha [Anaeramoeba flamelloides]|uniref:Importin subunit alpha n=1 Tax=Anaeramoeba flamelloides TaxID=1746091 RepID=A0ABQ8YSH1_9EUKA|nr:importin alpha [Anaeramoeba flamelloides]